MPLMCPVYCNCYSCTVARIDRDQRPYSYPRSGGRTLVEQDRDNDSYHGRRSASDQEKVDNFRDGKPY